MEWPGHYEPTGENNPVAHKDVKSTRLSGKDAEKLACEYLQDRHLRLITRNYRCRRGEIDLIMQHGDSLVFVEVRYRHYPGYGSAAESIDIHKQQKIIHCAQNYLQRNPAHAAHPGRFDVVCITPGEFEPEILWITDAFQM